jgi:hypothetical protein
MGKAIYGKGYIWVRLYVALPNNMASDLYIASHHYYRGLLSSL